MPPPPLTPAIKSIPVAFDRLTGRGAFPKRLSIPKLKFHQRFSRMLSFWLRINRSVEMGRSASRPVEQEKKEHGTYCGGEHPHQQAR